MTIDSNKQLVRRFLEGNWNYEKLLTLDDLLTPDYVFHDPVGETHGVREFRDEVAEELEAFAGVLVQIDDIVAEGDRVSVRYTTTYVHDGEFMHAYPTGRLTTLHGMAIYRIAGGLIAETWEAYDRRALSRDLGSEQRLSDADDAAIRNVIEDAQKIGFGNRQMLAGHYWAESAEVVAANGQVIRGRRAIGDWLQRFPAVLDWRLFDLRIDGAGEVACVRGRYSMEFTSQMPFDKGHYLEIWRKQSDSSWKVVRQMYASELAASAPHRAPTAFAHA